MHGNTEHVGADLRPQRRAGSAADEIDFGDRRTGAAERLRRSIAGETFAVNKGTKRIDVTISIGLATLDHKDEPVADVLKRADMALYQAKHDGRNRVVSTAA